MEGEKTQQYNVNVKQNLEEGEKLEEEIHYARKRKKKEVG